MIFVSYAGRNRINGTVRVLDKMRLIFSRINGPIMNLQYDQLPVGLIAQLVEHCIGITEVMGSNPVQAFFLQLPISYVNNCKETI